MSQTEISLTEFATSLPEEYRLRFGPAQVAAHAHTAVGRHRGKVAVRRFPWPGAHVTALCVVAEDRPGLLSLISAALTELGFDVDSAEAYTRSVDPPEAVDLFFIRDENAELGEDQIHAFAELVEEILAGRPATAHRGLQGDAGLGGTTVRFLEDANGHLNVLEVETNDRSGLLWAITRALFEQNVQIVASRVRTVEGRVHDSFTITELDGSAILPDRRLMIQVALLSAIQPQLTPSPPPLDERA